MKCKVYLVIYIKNEIPVTAADREDCGVFIKSKVCASSVHKSKVPVTAEEELMC